jgi:hypothetical protein
VNDGREIEYRTKKVDFEGVPSFGPPCVCIYIYIYIYIYMRAIYPEDGRYCGRNMSVMNNI